MERICCEISTNWPGLYCVIGQTANTKPWRAESASDKRKLLLNNRSCKEVNHDDPETFRGRYSSTCINVRALLELTYHELSMFVRVFLQVVSDDHNVFVLESYGVASDCKEYSRGRL